jgi:hypothetical protein
MFYPVSVLEGTVRFVALLFGAVVLLPAVSVLAAGVDPPTLSVDCVRSLTLLSVCVNFPLLNLLLIVIT